MSIRADKAQAGEFENFGVTIAGGNGYGAGATQLAAPHGLAIDSAGNIYVADSEANRVQKCEPGYLACVTVAGANGSPFGQLTLSSPYFIALDASENLYIGDWSNHRVLKCVAGSTTCVTVAGGNGEGSGANQLDYPAGMAFDSGGNLYVADYYNHRIQKCVTGSTTCVTVLGGTGAGSGADQLNSPGGLLMDSSDNLYIADTNNSRVQKCVLGSTLCTTVAGGNGSGPGSNQLYGPYGVALDGNGFLYISDSGNQRVQKCLLGTTTCITVAGGNGNGIDANQFHGPFGVVLDSTGNLYVSDVLNNRVQKWSRTGAQTITFDPLQNKFEAAASFELTASATSGLPVSFSSATLNICTVAGTTVTLAGGVGTCTIVASQPGNQSFLVAPTVSRSFQVERKAIVVRVADSGASEGSGPGGTTISTVFGTDRPSSAPLCVWYSTVGVTATGADQINAWDGTQDFTRLGVSTPKYVILGTNRTSGKISTKINYDTTIEDDEYFNIVISKVTLRSGGKCLSSAVPDSRVVLARDTGRVTILDDDTPLPEN